MLQENERNFQEWEGGECNKWKTSFRDWTAPASLGAQACTEPEKVKNENYAVSVYNKDGIKNIGAYMTEKKGIECEISLSDDRQIEIIGVLFQMTR